MAITRKGGPISQPGFLDLTPTVVDSAALSAVSLKSTHEWSLRGPRLVGHRPDSSGR